MLRARRSGLAWVLATGLAGCASGGDPDGGAGLMAAHFEGASDVQEAIVSGDRERASDVARRLARASPGETIPDGARGHDRAFRREAVAASVAADLATAAAATGRLFRACGTCHEAVGLGPGAPTAGTPPPPGQAVREQMASHGWAVDRLAEGLVVPSDTLWNAGARYLSEAPIAVDEAIADTARARVARGMARQVHALARDAAGTPEWDERAALYGEILATCARCHDLTGRSVSPRRPRPSPPATH